MILHAARYSLSHYRALLGPRSTGLEYGGQHQVRPIFLFLLMKHKPHSHNQIMSLLLDH